MGRAHGNSQAISDLIRAGGAQKQAVALAAGLSAPALSHVLTARRHAFDPAQQESIRQGLSEVLGFEVSARTVVCTCDDPASHKEPRDG